MQSQHPSISTQLQQSIAQFKTALARFKQEAIKVKTESIPLSWTEYDLVVYTTRYIEVRFPGKLGMDYQLVTQFTWDQKPDQRLPKLWWNSEHLAYHLCDRSTYHCGIDHWGQEQEVTEYVARPLWGLLGEHNYSW